MKKLTTIILATLLLASCKKEKEVERVEVPVPVYIPAEEIIRCGELGCSRYYLGHELVNQYDEYRNLVHQSTFTWTPGVDTLMVKNFISETKLVVTEETPNKSILFIDTVPYFLQGTRFAMYSDSLDVLNNYIISTNKDSLVVNVDGGPRLSIHQTWLKE